MANFRYLTIILYIPFQYYHSSKYSDSELWFNLKHAFYTNLRNPKFYTFSSYSTTSIIRIFNYLTSNTLSQLHLKPVILAFLLSHLIINPQEGRIIEVLLYFHIYFFFFHRCCSIATLLPLFTPFYYTHRSSPRRDSAVRQILRTCRASCFRFLSSTRPRPTPARTSCLRWPWFVSDLKEK